jgi:hypothetical protein
VRWRVLCCFGHSNRKLFLHLSLTHVPQLSDYVLETLLNFGSTHTFVNFIYRMLSPYLMYHHASHVLGCWKERRWLIKRSGLFMNNGSYYFQSDIIVNEKRLVLPSSEDVSTWLERAWLRSYSRLKKGGFLAFWGTTGDGPCWVRGVLGSSGAHMSSSPSTSSPSSACRRTS